ncbi:DUF3054 domain-containing protein [Brevibacillus massiliensis]|uniref:DUF3054 domain-containing protein n=1 Tax=Brevibacillus massiliensis TaxID=1118054 RepID=UPI000318F187|nr:DUF3054 domain-containing protein [Brevibacillus massiliensis]
MKQSTMNRSTTSTVILLLGDLVMILLFTLIGMKEHDRMIGITGLFYTAAPFLIGWVITAPLLGAYRPAAVSSVKTAAWRAFLVWVAVEIVSMVIRALFFGKPFILSFAIVTLIANTILLAAWRMAYSWFIRRGKM